MPKPINLIINELSQPWPDYEKTKDEGARGKNKYIPWTGCRRILDACAPGWHSEIKEIKELAGRIVATVRIYVEAAEGPVYREGAAWVQIPADGKAMYGDPVKNSTSNAFKRAAYQFGIGEYLRGKNQSFESQKPKQPAATSNSNATTQLANVAQLTAAIRSEYNRLGWTMGQDRAFEMEELHLETWGPEMLGLATATQLQAMLTKLRQIEKPVNLTSSLFWEVALAAKVNQQTGWAIVAKFTQDNKTDWTKAVAKLREFIDWRQVCAEHGLDSQAAASVLKQNNSEYKLAIEAVKREFKRVA